MGLLQLHGALGAAVLIAADGDLIRTGTAYRDWPRLRVAVGRVGLAEAKVDTAEQLTSLSLEQSARAVVGAERAIRGHPWAAVALSAALVGGALVYHRSHEWPSIAPVKSRLENVGRGLGQLLHDVNKQYQLGETVLTEAERHTVGETKLLNRVTQLLARNLEPMTRTEILAAVGEFPGRTHRDRMDDLYALLSTYPAFCEIAPHQWQLGRTNVGSRLFH